MITDKISDKEMDKIEEIVKEASVFLRDKLHEQSMVKLNHAYMAILLMFKRNMDVFNMLAEGEEDLLKLTCKLLLEPDDE